MKQLCAEKQIEVRFSEVDIMNVVWHGSYPLYFEDAREAFGKKYDLAYQRYIDEKVFAPIVELNIKYRRPLTYGMKPIVRITYVPTEAAKVIFDYEIVDPDDGTVFVTARSIQVFMNQQYQLLWDNPEFYRLWKERWL
jgi:acyl-CoA thioester hydrolase